MSTPAGTLAPHSDLAPERGRTLAASTQWIALASVVAGSIHLAVVQEHLEHWWVYGAFFVVLGCLQLAFAVLMVRRPAWPLILVGIVVNVSVVLLYVASRTTGLPVTPPQGHTAHGDALGVEGVGVVDIAATGAELVMLYLLVTLLPERLRRPTVNVLLGVGLGLWGLRLAGALG